jgi:cellulose synthase operon protein C
MRAYIPSQAPMTPRQQAESALASLEGSYSGWLGATGIGRYRAGTAGLDRLNDIESPVELSAVVSRLVRFSLIAQPVFLNSGVLGTSSLPGNYVPFLGTLPANTTTPPAQQSSNGIGGEAQMTSRAFDLAVGYTPYEFLVHNLTGRLHWRPFDSRLTLYADRGSVKDTQLSYAGLRDPGVSVITGPIWGGVIATTGGARLDFGKPSSGSGFYVSGNGGILEGRHVLNNTRFGGEAGAYFRVGNWPGHGSLTVGGIFNGMHYEHNEVGLTYGQGGYFSPSSYFHGAMPVTFKGVRKSTLHYSATGTLGVQHFRQEIAPFYPLDPKLQSSFVPPAGVTCTNPQIASYSCGQYPLTVTTAFSYAVDAEVSYLIGYRLYAGAFAYGSNTNNYNSFSGGFFLRYTFRKQVSSEGRPTGLFPVRGFRPLQIP